MAKECYRRPRAVPDHGAGHSCRTSRLSCTCVWPKKRRLRRVIPVVLQFPVLWARGANSGALQCRFASSSTDGRLWHHRYGGDTFYFFLALGRAVGLVYIRVQGVQIVLQLQETPPDPPICANVVTNHRYHESPVWMVPVQGQLHEQMLAQM